VLLSSRGTLSGIDRSLRRAGVRLVRVPVLEVRTIPSRAWRARVAEFGRIDTVVTTSRHGVTAGVVPWRKGTGQITPAREFWAVGPGTAQALREVGVPRVRRSQKMGSLPLVRALARPRARSVLYFRSDCAGPAFARALRREGHRVLDVTVYRIGGKATFTPRTRNELGSARVWVAASPSALAALRRSLGSREFARRARTTSLVVLGERSRREASKMGFRTVSVAPATAAQRFTRHLLSVLRDAGD
jgi:uroporphyrinogen-III synthase